MESNSHDAEKAVSAPAAAWRLSERHVGHEKSPVLIIDDFAPDPAALTAAASRLPFRPLAPFYPGVRAPAPVAYLRPAMAPLGALLRETFSFTKGADLLECFFSLATTRPEHLVPIQRLPHFDGVGDRKVALLHYLCGPEHGGTAFYRHRSTGFETVTDARFPAYKAALEKDVSVHGPPAPAYFAGSDKMFEQIDFVEARYNRAILYRGINLHAIELGPTPTYSAHAERGRLTVNIFLAPLA